MPVGICILVKLTIKLSFSLESESKIDIPLTDFSEGGYLIFVNLNSKFPAEIVAAPVVVTNREIFTSDLASVSLVTETPGDPAKDPLGTKPSKLLV